MRRTFAIAAALLTLGASAEAQAGCLGGAVVGGVGGLFAGQHSVIGAVGGCVAGLPIAAQKERERQAYRDAWLC